MEPGRSTAASTACSRAIRSFFCKQLAAVTFSSAWAFVFTFGMLWIIDRVTAVRVEDAHEEVGLDEALHGETAYLEPEGRGHPTSPVGQCADTKRRPHLCFHESACRIRSN